MRSNNTRRELFDYSFYRARYGLSIPPGVDPLDHYIEHGWKLGFDPSPSFSTNYYLERNPDVAEAGFNPLVHYVFYGEQEGRRPAPYTSALKDYSHKPSLSVIVPVYNHQIFLPKRFASIVAQNYENMELIVLDDASTDDSFEVAERLVANIDIPCRMIRNEENSGGVFRQWEKGMKLATGDLIWICESDDFCDPGFLREIIPLFSDKSIMLAFGDIQFCSAEGQRQEGLDWYRESAEPDIWNSTLVRTAAEWFTNGFGVRNVIPNVGGCVFRNQTLSDDEWAELRRYGVVGDWYFYLVVARGGRIAYEPAAQAFFRQHALNTSVRAFGDVRYYEEHEKIAMQIATRWGYHRASAERLQEHMRDQYNMYFSSKQPDLKTLFSALRVSQAQRQNYHVLISLLGFYLGGGELFPIMLANLLVERGLTVSVLVMQTHNSDERVEKKLDNRVAVYDFGVAEEAGPTEFLRSMKVDLVHSHNVASETFFFRDVDNVGVPYLVTLHGSYEFATLDRSLLTRITTGVDHWVYLTDRNLRHIEAEDVLREKTSKIPNAVKISQTSPPFLRAQLGISDDAFVFAIVTRALKEKGWEEAAVAFSRLMAGAGRDMHLLFCGTGPEADRLGPRYSSANIHFLGFQSDPHGIYRISNCGILASRFGGESYPLTVVEALQVGTPMICADVGECRTILETGEGLAGLLIEPVLDNEVFISHIYQAMKEVSRPKVYSRLSRRALYKAPEFNPTRMVDTYLELYGKLTARSGSVSSGA